MAVYTPVRREELQALLRDYDTGTLVDYRGIGEGIENTNYFVTTEQGEYVLTLFESIGYDDLPYYLDLMAFLAEHGVPSAHPLPDRSGAYLRHFKDRPAALLQRLAGHGVMAPGLAHCRAVGDALGHLHQAGRHFTGYRANARGPGWWRHTATRLLPRLDPAGAALLRAELDLQWRHRHADLPRGVVHADLFRDNALFVGERLTGIIDFYFACNDALLFDVAVTVNDWCVNDDGAMDSDATATLLDAYRRWREPSAAEKALWPVLLRAGALRFWLSRLQDQIFPRPGEITQIKDPDVFRRRLESHGRHHDELADQWR